MFPTRPRDGCHVVDAVCEWAITNLLEFNETADSKARLDGPARAVDLGFVGSELSTR